MVQSHVQKLRHGARLDAKDEAVLTRLAQPVRNLAARRDVMSEGHVPRSLPLIIQGWACRYRLLENGKRQIISLLLPGDLCEPFGVLPRLIGHPVGALTPLSVAFVSPQAIAQAVRTSPRIEEALWWDLLLASTIERENIVNLGRRSAGERMGHLFCELHLRLKLAGLVDKLSYEFPLTQVDLADLLGLSTVHVNRSLQDFRSAGWISLRGRQLTIHDLQALREFSFFDPAYLQFDRPAFSDVPRDVVAG